jgi:hydroxymethylglutaryl-CoA reductase
MLVRTSLLPLLARTWELPTFRSRVNFHLTRNCLGEMSKTRYSVEVIAWGSLSDSVCQAILGCDTTRLRSVISKFKDGSTRNGQMGQNINTANVMSAMFISCGQDAASVVESGWVHLTADLDEETKVLTLSLYIPSLLVGTVGGGTHYPSQRESLELIRCYGDGKKWALAETIAAFALALDASTVSAIANDTFASSHQNLARGLRQSKM